MKTLRSYTKNVIANSSVILSYTKLDNLLSKLSYALWVGTEWSLFDHLATCCLSGHDPRMGRRIFVGALFAAFCFFTACDDSSSGAGPDPVAEVSSSSGDEAISSSSVTDKGTSSGGGSVSSSSSVKSDMSSSVGTVQSSSSLNVKSSSSKAWTCKEEGKSVTRYNEATGLIDVYLCTNGVYELVVYSSSSEKVYTFKELFKEDSVFNKNMEYGTFVDSRDGQEYKTIEIYFNYKEIEYFTVFAQNLNYGTQVKLETTAFDDDKVEKFCYDDDPWYCEHYFGGLYSWSEAMGLPKACDSVKTGATPDCPDSVAPGIVYEAEWSELQIQGICPDGWHVMNEREWRALIHGDESASRAISKASYGGNESGFSALFNGQSHRIQLPFRRPRNAGRAPAFKKRSSDGDAGDRGGKTEGYPRRVG